MDPRKFVKRLPVADKILDHIAAAGADGDRRAALLNALLPLSSLSSSLTFLVESGPVLSHPARLPALTALLAPGTPLTGAQVVVHTQPPEAHVPPLSDAYRQLIGHGCAANRWTYVAVSSPDLEAAATWTKNVLAQHGFEAVRLDQGQVLDAVAFLTGLDASTAANRLIDRGFETCRIGAGLHACYTWGDAPLLELLSLFPSLRATVGVRLAPAGGEFVAERVLRLTAPTKAALTTAEQWLTRANARLVRLNGHHASAAAATVPVCVPPVWPSKHSWTHVEPVHVAGSAVAWTGGAGVVVGWDLVRGAHVPLRLFREQPVTGLVSSVKLAKLVALRAVSCGAVVTVQTGDPLSWQGPFHLAQPGAPALRAGSRNQPHLLVIDRPDEIPALNGLPGTHHACLVVADPLGTEHVPLLDHADIVVAGDLNDAQKALLRGVFSEWLTELPWVPGEVSVLSRGVAARVGITPTAPEQHLLG